MSRAGTLASACALTAALLAAGCSSPESRTPAPSTGNRDATAAPAPSSRPRIVMLGDSLTAGLGLPPDQAYPAVVQRHVDAAGLTFEVVNMGVSGDTSAGGVRRIDWALDGDVRVLVLALGANDGLRGLSVAELEANLSQVIDRARDRDVTVLLCGMEAPPNMGPVYASQFRAVYRALARRPGVIFIPFLLDGIAGVPALNQADGIHPNAEGARRMADLLWAGLEPLLTSMASR